MYYEPRRRSIRPIPHIEAWLGAIRLATLDREDVACWIDELAAGGKLSRRSVQICRTVLHAALSDAVDEGLIPRSPAARVGLPRTVAKPVKPKAAVAWTTQEVDRFLAATADHRWAIAFRPGVLYGLRRSEVLALRWDDLDTSAGTVRIDESLVAIKAGAAWDDAKSERSRRTIPIDDETFRVFARRRAEQAAARLACGSSWHDLDLVIATRTGKIVSLRTYDRALANIVDKLGLPRLTSRGLRHTAATHMVQTTADVGELRAIADILGQQRSPQTLVIDAVIDSNRRGDRTAYRGTPLPGDVAGMVSATVQDHAVEVRTWLVEHIPPAIDLDERVVDEISRVITVADEESSATNCPASSVL